MGDGGAARGGGDAADPAAAASPAERFLEVTRTARYFALGQAGPATREAWLLCHGYGQLAGDFLEGCRVLAHPSRLLVAPEALNRYYTAGDSGPHGPDAPVGATWMTRVDRLHEIDDYVRYLDRVHEDAFADAGDASVVALGFSQGTATVARWAARTGRRVDHVVLWGGPLPPELEPSPDLFGGATLTVVIGERDRFVNDERIARETARLDAGGMSAEVMRFAGGHRLDDDALLRLAERLSRRS